MIFNVIKRLKGLKRPARTVKERNKHCPTSAALLLVLAARALLHDQIDQSARNGVVVDALPSALARNHADGLNDLRRQLSEEQQVYTASMRRLDAMYAELEPEPAPPRPPQSFFRLGKLIGKPQGRAADPFH